MVDGTEVKAMIDTGATVTVWRDGSKALIGVKRYPVPEDAQGLTSPYLPAEIKPLGSAILQLDGLPPTPVWILPDWDEEFDAALGTDVLQFMDGWDEQATQKLKASLANLVGVFAPAKPLLQPTEWLLYGDEDINEPPPDTVVLTAEQQQQLDELLDEFKECFGEPGTVKDYEVTIEVDDPSTLRKNRPYRANPQRRSLLADCVQKALAARKIRPSKSPVAAPVLLALKRDGSSRCASGTPTCFTRNLPCIRATKRWSASPRTWTIPSGGWVAGVLFSVSTTAVSSTSRQEQRLCGCSEPHVLRWRVPTAVGIAGGAQGEPHQP